MPLLGIGGVSEVTRQYRCRLASLLHVDDGVAQIIDALGRTGELERTLIVFTSDNGMLLGEHRIGASKIWPYEESIHVPLLARGPGLPAGARVEALTVNADVTATILDAADVAPGVVQDGASLFERIAAPSATRELLIESFQPSPVHTPYAAVKTWRYLYVEYVTGERELYDHQVDPYELRNAVTDPAYAPVVEWMAARLAALRHCQGASCRESWGEPPAPLDLDPPATRIDKHPIVASGAGAPPRSGRACGRERHGTGSRSWPRTPPATGIRSPRAGAGGCDGASRRRRS
jgi:N-acetylglucosamine-6-sulfatase